MFLRCRGSDAFWGSSQKALGEVKREDIIRGHEVSKGDYVLVTDEVRDPRDEIEDLPDAGAFRGKELTIARQLIDSMTIDWNPENYQDTYREGVEDLIERKRRGEEVTPETAPSENSSVVELADAPRRSMDAQRRPSAGAKSTAGAPARRGSGARPAGRRTAGGGTNRTRSSGKPGTKPKSSPKRKAS